MGQREHPQQAEPQWGKFPGADRSLGCGAGSAGHTDGGRRSAGGGLQRDRAPRHRAARFPAVAHQRRRRAGEAGAVQLQEMAGVWRLHVEHGGLVSRPWGYLPLAGQPAALIPQGEKASFPTGRDARSYSVTPTLPARYPNPFASAVRRTISTNSGLRLAPPTSAPSMLGRAANSAMLVAVTLPPYWTRTAWAA